MPNSCLKRCNWYPAGNEPGYLAENFYQRGKIMERSDRRLG